MALELYGAPSNPELWYFWFADFWILPIKLIHKERKESYERKNSKFYT